MLSRKWLWCVPVGALLVFSLAQAQDAQPREGRGGRRGNFDPAQARQRMEEFFKTQLGATDDEWKVLQPKLEKVMNAQRDAGRGFGGGMMGGRGGPRGERGDRGGDQNRPSNRPESKVAKARTELNTTLENKSASPDEIKAKLKAYRDAREQARADLQAAQRELKEVCSVRQEATLVMLGALE